MALHNILKDIQQNIVKFDDKNLLVGFDTKDDAAVYKINEDIAIIQTVDFFTPIVDDPYIFGQIAACNAINDVYAMGGKPILALNVAIFPEELLEDILPKVLKGGADKAKEAGVIVCGGHTIKGKEPAYGMAVMGMVSPKKIITNAGAKAGDLLILTKPIGLGVISTLIKADMADQHTQSTAIKLMTTLNKEASEACIEIGVNAITDVTGFGLAGHAHEVATASSVSIIIYPEKVPIIKEIIEYVEMGFLPAGLHTNRKFLEKDIYISENIDQALIDLMFDPQTAGGLLISCDPEKTDSLLKILHEKEIKDAKVIGKVTEKKEKHIYLVKE